MPVDNNEARTTATGHSCKTLCATLKDDSANIKLTDIKMKILTATDTDLNGRLFRKKTKKMPPHIAHICLCLLMHKPTKRQSQKSAIANALSKSRFKLHLLQY